MDKYEGTIVVTYEAEGIFAEADSPEAAIALMKERERNVAPGTIVDIEVDLIGENNAR